MSSPQDNKDGDKNHSDQVDNTTSSLNKTDQTDQTDPIIREEKNAFSAFIDKVTKAINLQNESQNESSATTNDGSSSSASAADPYDETQQDVLQDVPDVVEKYSIATDDDATDANDEKNPELNRPLSVRKGKAISERTSSEKDYTKLEYTAFVEQIKQKDDVDVQVEDEREEENENENENVDNDDEENENEDNDNTTRSLGYDLDASAEKHFQDKLKTSFGKPSSTFGSQQQSQQQSVPGSQQSLYGSLAYPGTRHLHLLQRRPDQDFTSGSEHLEADFDGKDYDSESDDDGDNANRSWFMLLGRRLGLIRRGRGGVRRDGGVDGSRRSGSGVDGTRSRSGVDTTRSGNDADDANSVNDVDSVDNTRLFSGFHDVADLMGIAHDVDSCCGEWGGYIAAFGIVMFALVFIICVHVRQLERMYGGYGASSSEDVNVADVLSLKPKPDLPFLFGDGGPAAGGVGGVMESNAVNGNANANAKPNGMMPDGILTPTINQETHLTTPVLPPLEAREGILPENTNPNVAPNAVPNTNVINNLSPTIASAAVPSVVPVVPPQQPPSKTIYTMHLTRPLPQVLGGLNNNNNLLSNPFAPGGSLGPDSAIGQLINGNANGNAVDVNNNQQNQRSSLTIRQGDALRALYNLFPQVGGDDVDPSKQLDQNANSNPNSNSPNVKLLNSNDILSLEDPLHPLPSILKDALIKPAVNSEGTSGISLNHAEMALKSYFLFTKGGGIADLKMPPSEDLIRKKLRVDPDFYASGIGKTKDIVGGASWRGSFVDKEGNGDVVVDDLWKNGINAVGVNVVGEGAVGGAGGNAGAVATAKAAVASASSSTTTGEKNVNKIPDSGTPLSELTTVENLPWVVGSKEEQNVQCGDTSVGIVLREALKIGAASVESGQLQKQQQQTNTNTNMNNMNQASPRLSEGDATHLENVFRKLVSPECGSSIDKAVEQAGIWEAGLSTTGQSVLHNKFLPILLKLHEQHQLGVEVMGSSSACANLMGNHNLAAATGGTTATSSSSPATAATPASTTPMSPCSQFKAVFFSTWPKSNPLLISSENLTGRKNSPLLNVWWNSINTLLLNKERDLRTNPSPKVHCCKLYDKFSKLDQNQWSAKQRYANVLGYEALGGELFHVSQLLFPNHVYRGLPPVNWAEYNKEIEVEEEANAKDGGVAVRSGSVGGITGGIGGGVGGGVNQNVVGNGIVGQGMLGNGVGQGNTNMVTGMNANVGNVQSAQQQSAMGGHTQQMTPQPLPATAPQTTSITITMPQPQQAPGVGLTTNVGTPIVNNGQLPQQPATNVGMASGAKFPAGGGFVGNVMPPSSTLTQPQQMQQMAAGAKFPAGARVAASFPQQAQQQQAAMAASARFPAGAGAVPVSSQSRSFLQKAKMKRNERNEAKSSSPSSGAREERRASKKPFLSRGRNNDRDSPSSGGRIRMEERKTRKNVPFLHRAKEARDRDV